MTIDFKAHHVRAPEKAKSEDWHKTADRWLCSINGVEFDYYTGIGHRIGRGKWIKSDSNHTFAELKRLNLTEEGMKQLIRISKPVAPKLDDVLQCLLTDAIAAEMSFDDWCGELGQDSDSIKALEVYHTCQKIGGKLRKAKIDITHERKRLEDY